ncbi:MAG: hypothetical protein KDK41_08135 [Leptospiraceae bacterium]|nr:hypothetical protein [Leptospiraceae bacterium]MCB1200601.1 hypothetical protein [Leptospiraceae bacterium]
MPENLIVKLNNIEAQLAQLQNVQCESASAAKILISLVPMLGVILGTTLLFFFILWQYKLRKELIRSGNYKPVLDERIRTLSLLIGLLSIAVGLPMTILFLIIEGVSYSVLGGLLPFSAGIGLLLFFIFSGKKIRETT